MLTGLIFALSLTTTSGECSGVGRQEILSGNIVLGFETSYISVIKGKYRGQKIWIEEANKLEAELVRKNSSAKGAWKRANGIISGCVAGGRFGHLGLYKFKVSKIDIALN